MARLKHIRIYHFCDKKNVLESNENPWQFEYYMILNYTIIISKVKNLTHLVLKLSTWVMQSENLSMYENI